MHAAVIATLPSTASRAYTLTVGGGDVNVTGESGAAFMVDIESIVVEEEGPAGVSSMDFTIRDPNKELAIDEMAPVEFWDVTNNLPLFRGFVQSWSFSGIVERTIAVHCIGMEAVQDWLTIPAITYAALDQLSAGAIVQSLYGISNAIGVSLNTARGSGSDGSQDTPVADFTIARVEDIEIPDGTTLREALRIVASVFEASDVGMAGLIRWAWTIDYLAGLRWWVQTTQAGVMQVPGDYVNLTLTDTVGAGTAVSIIDHDIDAAGVIRGVYVVGGNAAGTGFIGDGTGIPGPTAVISDSSILTATLKEFAAKGYLAEHGVGERGSVTVENLAPTTNIHPASHLTLTNTVAAISATTYVIASITKRFYSTKQTWVVQYGGLRPSAIRQLRRLTRTTLS